MCANELFDEVRYEAMQAFERGDVDAMNRAHAIMGLIPLSSSCDHDHYRDPVWNTEQQREIHSKLCNLTNAAYVSVSNKGKVNPISHCQYKKGVAGRLEDTMVYTYQEALAKYDKIS